MTFPADMQVSFVVDDLCIFSPLQSHGPKVEDDSLHVPLLKDKKRTGSKAPTVVLGEQSSMFQITTSFLDEKQNKRSTGT
jgi:hypothetical protein